MYANSSLVMSLVSPIDLILIGLQNLGDEGSGFCHIIFFLPLSVVSNRNGTRELLNMFESLSAIF